MAKKLMLKPLADPPLEPVEFGPERRIELSEYLRELDKWPVLAEPENYLDRQAGRYLRILEGLIGYSLAVGDILTTRLLVNDLLRLTKLGRPKVEIGLTGGESEAIDLSQASEEDLRKLVKESIGDEPDSASR